MFVAYNMLAVHVLRLELGVIILSYVIVGLTGVHQGYLQDDIFRHFAARVTGGSFKMLSLLS